MANANAQTHDIDLASPNLNLDKYKLGVSQFDGFNYRNSPFISHEIKNLYTKQTGADVWIDENNNEYKLDGYDFKKNSKTIRTFKNDGLRTSFFNVSELEDFEYDLNHNKAKIINKGNTAKLGYANGRIYFTKAGTTVYSYLPANFTSIDEIIDSMYVTSFDVCWVAFVATKQSDSKQYICVARIKGTNQSGNPDYVECGLYDNNNEYILCGYSYFYETSGSQNKLINSCCLWCNKLNVHNYYYLSCDNSYAIYYNNSSPAVTYILDKLSLSDFIINYTDINGNNITRTIHNSSDFIGDKHGIMQVKNFSSSNVYLSNDKNTFYATGVVFAIKEIDIGAYGSGGIYTFCPELVCNDNYVGVLASSQQHLYPNGIFALFERITDNTIIQHSRWHTQVSVMVNRDSDDDDRKTFYISLSSMDFCISFSYIPTQKLFTNGATASFVPIDNTDNLFSFRILFTGNNIINGVSVVEGHSDTIGSAVFPLNTIEDVIDVHQSYDNGYDYTDTRIIVKDKNNKLYELKFIQAAQFSSYNNKYSIIMNRYFIFHTAEYYNTYDVLEDKWYHAANDFNFSIGLSARRRETFQAVPLGLQSSVAAAVSAFYEIDKNPFPSMQKQSIIINNFLYEYCGYDNKVIPLVVRNTIKHNEDNYIDFGIDVFFNKGAESNNAYYVTTILNNKFKSLYENNLVYSNTEGNLLLPIPLCVKSENYQVPMIYNNDIGFNAPIHIQSGSPTGLYFLLAAQIDAKVYFTIQTALYCIIDSWICSYTYNNGIADNIKRVADVYGLDFLCSTPISAFFWSRYNKTIYQFQGDALLHRGQCIDEIDNIKQVKYNTATNDIIMCCDAYTIVLSEQYAFKIENIDNQPFTDVFWTKTDLCLRNSQNILMIRYNAAQLPYTKQNIIVKTQLYGLGDNMLSETDCVFIRVFNAENETGSQTVKVGGFTLTDKRSDLTTREYTINQSDWDEEKTYYIRYQPTFQKALGIQIEIESSVPITYIGVSNIPDTKMITKL